MSEETRCAVCQKYAQHKCGGCHEVFYCCKEHQRKAWRSHKKICRPFKISSDPNLGRHLVVTRDVKQGEIVLQESPLIWGPSQRTVPVCLGCCRAVTEKDCRPCSKCGWPVCSELCEKAPGHIPECRYTVLRGDKVVIRSFDVIHPTYQCITVLRCLYQKQFLPEVWKKIDTLESHCQERKNTIKYEQERVQIAKFLRRFFKLENTFTEEEILRVCGIVMVNSHEVPLTEPNYIAIYETCSMFEHDCSANCAKSFTNQGGVLISAGRPIKKGEHLSICYTDPLWGTPSRRQHLQESKFFWCRCSRCSDPTEYGTYFSAMRCQDSGCNGYLLPKTFLEWTPGDWFCDRCPLKLPSYSVHDLLERIGKDLSDMPKGDILECEKFIETYGEILPGNHYYLIDVKIVLSQLIGEIEGLDQVDDDRLEVKIRICRDLDKVMRVLISGERRVRGVLLFELHAALAEMGRRKGDPTVLMDSRNILSESVDLLRNEPDALPEGRIYRQALENLQEMDLVLRTVHNTIGDSP